MYTEFVYPPAASLMDVALLSISQASHGQLVKMLITWYTWINLHTCVFKHCPATGMKTHDEAAVRI